MTIFLNKINCFSNHKSHFFKKKELFLVSGRIILGGGIFFLKCLKSCVFSIIFL
ncbi:MAG: hypothetical protein RL757_364 [Bacteroidota bacterium]|jgi:hypothetical protein